MNCLAFDLGASSGKLVLGHFDGERLSLSPVLRFENRAVPLGDGLYWDFLSIYGQMREGLAAALAQPGGVHCFGMDAFCNDFGLVAPDGELLCPVHSYRDARTARCRSAIDAMMPPEELYHATGNQTALFGTLMQLAAMRCEGKDALLKKPNTLLHIPDLVCYYLTGVAATEYTLASVSQMYSYELGNWSPDILERFGLPAGILAPIHRPGTLLGHARGFGGQGFPVATVCQHDTASAFLASPLPPRSAIISSGTWALVGTQVEAPIINSYGYTHNLANEGGCEGRHRIIKNVMGSWLLQQLAADCAEAGSPYSFAQLEAMAETEKPLEWLFDVDDVRFFAPGNLRGKIRDVCLAHYGTAPESTATFARCIYDSLALKYRYALEKVEGLVGYRLPQINMVGGGSKDALLCRLTAGCCGRPVLAGPADATAIGNILAQLMALGELSGPEEGRLLVAHSFASTEYTPQPLPGLEEAYEDFCRRFALG